MITNELSAHGREKAGGSAFGPTWRRLLWWLWRHRHDRHGTWCRIRMPKPNFVRTYIVRTNRHRVSASWHHLFHHGIAAAVKGRWPAGIGHRIKSCVGACCVLLLFCASCDPVREYCCALKSTASYRWFWGERENVEAAWRGRKVFLCPPPA